MSFANSDKCTSSCPVWMHLISSSYLIALGLVFWRQGPVKACSGCWALKWSSSPHHGPHLASSSLLPHFTSIWASKTWFKVGSDEANNELSMKDRLDVYLVQKWTKRERMWGKLDQREVVWLARLLWWGIEALSYRQCILFYPKWLRSLSKGSPPLQNSSCFLVDWIQQDTSSEPLWIMLGSIMLQLNSVSSKLMDSGIFARKGFIFSSCSPFPYKKIKIKRTKMPWHIRCPLLY